MAAMEQKVFNTIGAEQEIFLGNYNLVTFSVISSPGANYTLLTSIDPNGSFVPDPVYNNYTIPSQDFMTNPGGFAITINNLGASGVIVVQYKTF